jgi:predicted ABC-type exoprotein transport system permease subunit
MQASDRRSEDWTFWIQVRSALSRVAALLIFLLAHKLLNVALEWTVPRNLANGVLWLEDIAYAAFSVIYAALVVEMVVVFIPALRYRLYPGEQGRSEKGRDVDANRQLRDRGEAED